MNIHFHLRRFIMQKIIQKIKEKKSLKNIDDESIEEEIEEFLRRNPKIKRRLRENTLKEKEKKQIIKEVRETFNKTYGNFWKGNNCTLKDHQSTKEREQFYPLIYQRIFNEEETILDIACGLNPLSYKLIPKYQERKFIGTELTKEDVKKLNNYFKEEHINGKALQENLLKEKKFPKADITLLLKILDIIERKGHKKAEEILENIQSKRIVVSFSTKTLHSKNMKNPRRGWIEQLLKRKKWPYKKFLIPGEEFYLIEKQNS